VLVHEVSFCVFVFRLHCAASAKVEINITSGRSKTSSSLRFVLSLHWCDIDNLRVHLRANLPRREFHQCVVNDQIKYFEERHGTSSQEQSEISAEITCETLNSLRLLREKLRKSTWKSVSEVSPVCYLYTLVRVIVYNLGT